MLARWPEIVVMFCLLWVAALVLYALFGGRVGVGGIAQAVLAGSGLIWATPKLAAFATEERD